ncbi:SMI1/KNR4 family protein [Paenibacillus rigui]|uniref:SMI1/KNR4 family protein n=1 Tax=Paenibacillus rigui TaxID=554312 RepID=A0A229UQ97_9BACL|nr:SMI1/KNR4 family protein [Paenibacillus rigui]OXM85727.1 SMI1/KNR4 family protein [Paenibacillus rigui]
MNIIHDTIVHPLPGDAYLNKEEGMWRVNLPIQYREFIKKNNGGVPEQNSFIANHRSYAIDRFLCILEDANNNKFGVYDIDVTLTRIEDRLTDNEDLVGVELLPIASLFSGDYLCLDFKVSNEAPSVCVWSHEESGELEPVSYIVSSSFEEFLELLS